MSIDRNITVWSWRESEQITLNEYFGDTQQYLEPFNTVQIKQLVWNT